MSESPDPAPCHLCGKESVMDADGVAWCEGCLHAKGSCCGESEMENPPDAGPHVPSGHGSRQPDPDWEKTPRGLN